MAGHLLLFWVVPEVTSMWDVQHLVMTYPVLKKDLPWVVHQVCGNISYCFLAMFGTVKSSWYFIGVSEAAKISSGCDDLPVEAETRSDVRRRRAVVTRRLALLAGIAQVPFANSSHKWSRELLEEAFDNGIYHIRCG